MVPEAKITLIDTVKKEFVPEMLARVAEIVAPEKIDYIVSNHVEMDHSGSLPEVVEAINPEKIICSKMGHKALLQHFSLYGPPAILLFDKRGNEVSDYRITGYQDAEQFLQTLNQAI
mgnify:CR=1 FL=1